MDKKTDTTTEKGIDRLLGIVARLRGKNGCPWDREQTLESLKQYLIEESYEVVDAIDSGNLEKHKEELGDVLLQVVLQAQIRNEKNEFAFDDVANKLADKLVRRHPHVFGDVDAPDAERVLKNWERIKANEKKGDSTSILDGIPRHLPALQKAQRIQSRVSRVGFDWAKVADVTSKVEEELRETEEAIESRDEARIKEEIGDLLFAVVNLSRFENVHSEEALEKTISKFIDRFRKIEIRVKSTGREIEECSLEEMEMYWNEAKGTENSV